MIRASRGGGGRPSKYRPEHAASLREHFESTVKRIDELITAGQRESLPFPTFSTWMRKQGVAKRTTDLWAVRHPEFKTARDFAKQIQQDLNKLALVEGFRFTLKEAA